jgi:hypothetical protein
MLEAPTHTCAISAHHTCTAHTTHSSNTHSSAASILSPLTQLKSRTTHCCAEIFEGSSPQQLVAALQGRRLLAAGRKGKNLWLTLEGQGPMPLMHFGEHCLAVCELSIGLMHATLQAGLDLL